MGTKRPGVETIIAVMKGLYERRQGPDRTGPHAGVYKWVARSFRWPPVDDMETERHVLLMTRCHGWCAVPTRHPACPGEALAHDGQVRLP